MTSSHSAGAPGSAADDYLLELRNLVSSGQPATVSTLARRVGVSSQAVSEMLGRLRSDGFVGPSEGRELCLTTLGRAHGDAIFRRHALAEWLLAGVIGMGWAESDREARHLQGAISDAIERQLVVFLGNPETCPHGNPIDAASTDRRPEGVPLSSLVSGDIATIYRITEEAEEDSELLSYLEARGLRPGAQVTVRASSGPLETLVLDGPRGQVTLGLRPAALIRVLPGAADPGLFHRLPNAGHATALAGEAGGSAPQFRPAAAGVLRG